MTLELSDDEAWLLTLLVGIACNFLRGEISSEECGLAADSPIETRMSLARKLAPDPAAFDRSVIEAERSTAAGSA